MKPTSTSVSKGLEAQEDAFNHFVESLRPSLKLWDFFVNWDKVFRNTREIEVHLNIWNYLLGKENFDEELRELLRQYPQIVRALPSLLVRDGSGSSKFSIVQNIQDLAAPEAKFDFTVPADTENSIEDVITFTRGTGLHKLFAKDGVKNLVDYVLGVEAGVDSHGRKNRSGTAMETVVSEYLVKFTSENSLEFITQATPSSIRAKWGFDIPVDKSSRRFDFAISDGKKLVIMEVNFYGGGGSKLKATAGEYIGLGDTLKIENVEFVWVTDGKGWLTTLLPMRAAYEKLDYVWNLSWLGTGALGDLFKD